MNNIFISIHANKVTVEFTNQHGEDVLLPVNDFQGYLETLESIAAASDMEVGELSLQASSSLDFPEEDTNDEETIALARQIRA